MLKASSSTKGASLLIYLPQGSFPGVFVSLGPFPTSSMGIVERIEFPR
jgi:hypothetical protein